MSSRAILLERLDAIHTDWIIFAEAWRSQGATAVALHLDDDVLLRHPDGTSLDTIAIETQLHFDQDDITLTVYGVADDLQMVRLVADASLLQKSLTRENEIETLTEEYIATQDQLVALYNLTRALSKHSELSVILTTLAEQAQQILEAEHTFVLYGRDTTAPLIGHAGEHPPALETAFSWFKELSKHQTYTTKHPDACQHWLLIPIALDNTVQAMLAVMKSTRLLMPQIKLASAIAEQGAALIENSLMYQEKLAQLHIQTEMSLARQVQTSLLPPPPKDLTGLDIWAYSDAAYEVGGDFYDIDQTDDKRTWVALGDVAGKGISAALLMAMARTALRVQNGNPAAILEETTHALYDDLTRVEAFVTLFVAQYEPTQQCLTYANAGQSPVIYCDTDGTTRMLEADCPPVGVLPMSMAEDHQLRLQVGDILVVASDGLPEASDGAGNMLGYDALMEIVASYRQHSAQEIGEMLLKAARTFATVDVPRDDQTLIVMKCLE